VNQRSIGIDPQLQTPAIAIIRAPDSGVSEQTAVAANILDGKAVAAKQRQISATRAAGFIAKHGRAPGLAVVKVGEDPASAVYVRNKRKAARSAVSHPSRTTCPRTPRARHCWR
jgi:hypothetical protein